MFVKLGNVFVNMDKVTAIYPYTGVYIKDDENDIRKTTIVFSDKNYTYSNLEYDEVCDTIRSIPDI